VLQCAAVCCSVLQCAAVCCSVLQCAAVCCSVLQCERQHGRTYQWRSPQVATTTTQNQTRNGHAMSPRPALPRPSSAVATARGSGEREDRGVCQTIFVTRGMETRDALLLVVLFRIPAHRQQQAAAQRRADRIHYPLFLPVRRNAARNRHRQEEGGKHRRANAGPCHTKRHEPSCSHGSTHHPFNRHCRQAQND